jgi:hypothetical protein
LPVTHGFSLLKFNAPPKDLFRLLWLSTFFMCSRQCEPSLGVVPPSAKACQTGEEGASAVACCQAIYKR